MPKNNQRWYSIRNSPKLNCCRKDPVSELILYNNLSLKGIWLELPKTKHVLSKLLKCLFSIFVLIYIYIYVELFPLIFVLLLYTSKLFVVIVSIGTRIFMENLLRYHHQISLEMYFKLHKEGNWHTFSANPLYKQERIHKDFSDFLGTKANKIAH